MEIFEPATDVVLYHQSLHALIWDSAAPLVTVVTACIGLLKVIKSVTSV